MILIAAVVVFAAEGTPSGAVLVGMFCGFYLPHLSRARRGWIPFNVGMFALTAAAAVGAYIPLRSLAGSTFPITLVPLFAATCAYLFVSLSALLGSYVVELRAVPRDVLSHIPNVFAEVLPFAGLGFVLGRMYLSLGAWVVVLMVVPILIARELFASYLQVTQSHEQSVSMLIRMLEAKDRYTAGHAERVAGYARYMGEELGFMPARMERLRFAALMHDIGKLVVPNHLLNKPGRLTAEEFAQVRIHEKVGVQMLSHIDFLRPIARDTHGDSMRFDPDDTEHPIEPYIIMIADAYDAMTSTRAYRKALSQDVAFTELRDKSGTQFHPECAQALIRAIEKRGEQHGAGFETDTDYANAPELGVGSAGLGDLAPSEAK
ncbi:MAG TPA: HD domain-containing phosphohydrolase [Acidimicrobiia bacterium]|nr:HD domain-containing phosphohydrolase [Acidimicrobiia bacterium]